MAAGSRRLVEPLDDDAVAMGAVLRRTRLAQGLTLKEVAARSGLSHAFISLIERGRARPSMPSFSRLASALGSTPVDLLTGVSGAPEPSTRPEPPSASIEGLVLRGAGPVPMYADTGGRTVLVDPGRIRVTEVLTERHGSNGLMVHDDHSELVYVLAGKVEVVVGGESTTLAEGDSIHYPAGTPHAWSSADDRLSRVLMIQY